MSLLDDCDLLIFDCDGVLVDSEVLAVEAFVEVLHDVGVHATPAMVERCFGMKQSDILLRIAESTGQTIPAIVGERLWPVTRRYFERSLRPTQGIAAFLTAMAGKRRCVASSSHPVRIKTSLDLTGLAAAFGPHVFSSHQVARGKPAPDLFLFAAASMGIAPARCLVVEDSIFGVQGARAAGMVAFGFVGGSHIPAGHAQALAAAGALSVEKSWEDLLRRISA